MKSHDTCLPTPESHDTCLPTCEAVFPPRDIELTCTTPYEHQGGVDCADQLKLTGVTTKTIGSASNVFKEYGTVVFQQADGLSTVLGCCWVLTWAPSHQSRSHLGSLPSIVQCLERVAGLEQSSPLLPFTMLLDLIFSQSLFPHFRSNVVKYIFSFGWGVGSAFAVDGDGYLSWVEFLSVLHSPTLSMQMNAADAQRKFLRHRMPDSGLMGLSEFLLFFRHLLMEAFADPTGAIWCHVGHMSDAPDADPIYLNRLTGE